MTAEQERKNFATHTLYRADDKDVPPAVWDGGLWLCRICGAGDIDLYLKPCTTLSGHMSKGKQNNP